jgi:acyl-CoA synthetase (AMP-forming)/AMP-acid ligase II
VNARSIFLFLFFFPFLFFFSLIVFIFQLHMHVYINRGGVIPLDVIPKSASGKILRRFLVDRDRSGEFDKRI